FQIALNAGKPFEGSSWWGYLTGSWTGIMTGGVYFLAVWMIFGSYAIMALQYAYITIEIMIVLAIGPITLAFGAMDFSRGVAVCLLTDFIVIGLTLLIYYLVI